MADLTRPAGAAVVDPLIATILQAPDDREAQRALEEMLAQHAGPHIRSAIARHARLPAARPGVPADEESARRLEARTEAHLATRLRALRRGAAGAAEARSIGDLRVLASTLAARTCEEWRRRRFPERARLRNRVRYLLAHDRRFLLRPTPDDAWRCGLAGRDARAFASGEAAGPGHRLPEPAPAPRGRVADLEPSPRTIGDLAADLLAKAGGTVDLDHLVEAIAERIALQEGAAGADAERDDLPAASMRDHGLVTSIRDDGAAAPARADAGPADPIAWLRRFWEEIERLPPLERSVMLLNLRDAEGQSVIGVFAIAGVAGLRAIAAALGMTPEKLAEQWGTLPLDDATIAGRLGLPRPQVMLLRRAARERLARRLAGEAR